MVASIAPSRETTNVKLAAIIQSKNEDQDEEKAFKTKLKLAKIRMHRAKLYNGGARYHSNVILPI
jgi:hypothetical protein